MANFVSILAMFFAFKFNPFSLPAAVTLTLGHALIIMNSPSHELLMCVMKFLGQFWVWANKDVSGSMAVISIMKTSGRGNTFYITNPLWWESNSRIPFTNHKGWWFCCKYVDIVQQNSRVSADLDAMMFMWSHNNDEDIKSPWVTISLQCSDLGPHQSFHDDVTQGKHFPRYWPFVWGIHRSKASDAELWCFLWSAPE